MGRPLKIAKAQAVLTITATTASSQLVTVSNNLNTLGVTKGMPFATASTVGGLTAGVTYYINKIVSASTFTVSATQLSVQPQTFPSITTTTGQNVKATVGIVDSGFNNPNGSNTSTGSSTFGVVGGNTAIIGSQTLVNVAFGANISGTIFASNASTTVVGLGTNFGALANGTQLYAYQGTPGSYSVNLLGTIANNVGNVTVAVANSSATGNVIGTSGNAQTLVAGTPVVFDTAFGGLTANTTYFVRNITNAAAFTVAAVPGGANVVLTSNSSVTSNAIQNQAVLGANSVVNAAGYNGYGDPILAALPEAGYIVRQKGKHKYLVTGTVTGITAPVYTANLANAALTPNTFNIQVTYADSSTAYLDTISDYNSQAFPATVAPGSLSVGTVYTIYQTGTTNWTAVGAAGNMTGTSFTATGTGSGTGLAILANAQPNVIGTFNSAVAANTYYTPSLPIVTVNNA